MTKKRIVTKKLIVIKKADISKTMLLMSALTFIGKTEGQYTLSPKIAVPTRTMLDPHPMAIL